MERVELFQVKIAFGIPEKKYNVDDEIPEDVVLELMELYEDTEFVSENICNPPLLIISLCEIPTPEWVASAIERINDVLERSQDGTSN